MVVKKAQYFYDEMNTTDKCALSEGSNKKLCVRTYISTGMSDNFKYLIIQHLSHFISARQKGLYTSTQA